MASKICAPPCAVTIWHCFCLFLSMFVCFCPFLSISVRICAFLLFTVCLCLFMSVSVCFCNFFVCFCPCLTLFCNMTGKIFLPWSLIHHTLFCQHQVSSVHFFSHQSFIYIFFFYILAFSE